MVSNIRSQKRGRRMDLLTYILLHFTNDKCRIEPYAQSRKWDIYKALLAYLNYLGWDLQ